MNISEMVLITLESWPHLAKRSFNWFNLIKSDIFWRAELSDKLLWIFISSSNIITLLILKFFLSFFTIVVIIVIISLYKSLKSKYRFERGNEDDKNRKIKLAVNLDPPRHFKFNTTSLTRLVIENWIKGYLKARNECEGALSEHDSLEIARKLPWFQTRPDTETLNWLNVTIESFWPSLKHFLDVSVFKDFLKPIKRKDNSTVNTKDLSGGEAKLSILLSTRRKLELLRRQERDFKQNNKGFPRYYSYLTYFTLLKMIFIYLKRFIVDCFLHRFKKLEKREIYKVNLNKFLSIKKILELNVNQGIKRPKTWSNNLNSSNSRNTIKSPMLFRDIRYRSAPLTRTKKVFCHEGLRGLISLDDLRRKRSKASARLGFASRKEIVLEEINLGLAAPRIDGIEYVKDHSSSYSYGNLLGSVESNITEKDENLSFALELSYQTDEQFRITLESVPLLGHVSLTKLNIKSRFLLTLNHPNSALDKDLKIFETPDDIIWPLINYFQVALVDVPVIDWHFDRVNGSVSGKGKCRWFMRSENPNSTGGYARWFLAPASRYLNPIRVLNHTYFKYLVHLCLCLSLRWFKPFDLKIGDKLYVKSIC